jgi:hypothetical protein
MPSHGDVIKLVVPATGLMGFSRERIRIVVHLGDNLRCRGLDLDRLVRVQFVVCTDCSSSQR